MSNDDIDPNDRSRLWVIRLSENLMKKSIINGFNGEKGPLSLLRKELAFKDDKKAMRTQILVNEGYCIHNIEIWFLFLLK